jgi:hypothetical protein
MSNLPVAFFDVTLLWRGDGKSSCRLSKSAEGRHHLQVGPGRRVVKEPSTHGRGPRQPSRSSTQAMGGGSRHQRFAIPLIPWKYKRTISDVDTSRYNIWYQFNFRYSNRHSDCPLGWTGHADFKSLNHHKSYNFAYNARLSGSTSTSRTWMPNSDIRFPSPNDLWSPLCSLRLLLLAKREGHSS